MASEADEMGGEREGQREREGGVRGEMPIMRRLTRPIDGSVGGEGIKEERNGDLFWKQWQWNNSVCVKDGRDGRGW